MYVELTKDNADNFTGLAPIELLSLIGNDDLSFGIGYTEAPDKLPDGVIIFSLDIERYIDEDIPFVAIRFFAVSEEKRGTGIFSGLMDEFLSFVSASGVWFIRADIPFPEEYNDACGALEHMGFEFDLEELFEMRKTLGELLEIPKLKPGAAETGCVPIKGLDQKQFYRYLCELIEKDGLEEYDLSFDIGEYDGDVSTVCIKDGKPEGILLVAMRPEGFLEVKLLRAFEITFKNCLIRLLHESLKQAYKKYHYDQEVFIKVRDESIGNLLYMLFPDDRAILVRRGYLYPEESGTSE